MTSISVVELNRKLVTLCRGSCVQLPAALPSVRGSATPISLPLASTAIACVLPAAVDLFHVVPVVAQAFDDFFRRGPFRTLRNSAATDDGIDGPPRLPPAAADSRARG